MGRRVWIIGKSEVTEKDIANASLNGCPEIANGIPSNLRGIISLDQLPFAYEEPEIVPSQVRDIVSEFDDFKTSVEQDLVALQTRTSEVDNLRARIESLEQK